MQRAVLVAFVTLTLASGPALAGQHGHGGHGHGHGGKGERHHERQDRHDPPGHVAPNHFTGTGTPPTSGGPGHLGTLTENNG
jgi:hypothetical protein